MGDMSIFGERSGSAPDRDASAPASTNYRHLAKGLFGALLSSPAAPARPPAATRRFRLA